MRRRRPGPAPPTAPSTARPAVRALEHVDGVMDRLYRVVPRNTWLVVTSDHGELFGEDGYFAHGPIAHENVFGVPLLEGVVP